MVNNKHRKWFLIGGLILTLILIFLPVVYTHFYHNFTGTAGAINGRIDLSSTDPADGEIYLDGDWEFYWDRFIVSELEQLSRPDLLMAVPDEWSLYDINGKVLPAGGVASYKLVLEGLSAERAVTMFIPDFGGAYRVFIDGRLTAESGVVSRNINRIFTVPKGNLYPVKLTRDTVHEAVIEVATSRFSGLYMTPVLGDYNQIVSKNNFRNSVRFILFGVALFSFLNIFMIYLLAVKRKMYSFWMPVMIFFILIRIMLTTEFYSFWQPILFFNLSYESINELMYFATFVLKFLLIFLVQEQCGISFNKREKIGFLSFYSMLFLIYLFVPRNIYNHYLSVYLPMLSFVLDVYIFIKIYLGRQKLMKFGMIAFWGIIPIVVGLALDSYYINGKIYMNMSLTLLFSFTVFSTIMSSIYTMRSADLYDDFTKSSSRLELAKSQIAMQKEYYDALSRQMHEIREIKHDINYFIGVMSRLAEEGNIERLRLFLSEYCEKIKMDQLPFFCEHTIANSIIGYYYLRAKGYGIPFESRCKISGQTSMSDSDLCIVLGNALDNAVFACRQMDTSTERFVSIEAGIMKGQWLIKVTNSYNGRLVIKDGRYISSKGGNLHGLGIRNIEKVVETYGGFIRISNDEKLFTLMVAVPENE